MSNRDVNPTQGFHATRAQLDWGPHEKHWEENWSTRPYAAADRGFEYYRPAYRYGAEAAKVYGNREWSEVEVELSVGWDRYEGRGARAWDSVKDAVRDAWERVRVTK